MKLKSFHLAIITLVVIFGGIALSSILGLWKTTNDKVPAVYKSGEFAGQYDPSDIRGSFTFDDIFNSFEVPIEDLARAFGVKDPERFASFQCKELESLYSSLAAEGKEVGTSSVRYFVALYKGLPINVEEGTYLLEPAVEVLKEKANLSEEQTKTVEKYSVALPDISTDSSESTATSGSATSFEGSTETVIKGKTTFKELLDWGVKKEDIERAINDKMPASGKIIKDYATEKDVEFSTIKEPLQELVDAVK